MDLKVGIAGLSPGWELILKQEGICFEIIDCSNPIPIDKYSAIIIVEEDFIDFNFDYLRNGGSVLFSAKAYSEIFKSKLKYVKTKKIIADYDSDFSQIGIIDIIDGISIPIGKDLKLEDSGLQIFSGKYEKGNFYIIPINIENELVDMTSCRRKFIAEREELPSEIVAKVSKAKIRKIVINILIKLHYKRNLPLVQKVYIPNSKGLFIFRVDTDFCSEEEATALYELCRKYNIRASWFLDTQDVGILKKTYANFEEQEIGLHCFRHLIFNNFEDNRTNIQKGIDNLQNFGMIPQGFAAPFGSWNSSLDTALKEFQFEYSSEFVPSYDDLPFFPFYDKNFSNVLQIPIHPISLGRLRRSHFSNAEKIRYYKNVIDKKNAASEPIIIYHHPHHKMLDVIEEIFRYVVQKKIPNMKMIEYATWWKTRLADERSVTLDDGKLTFQNYDEQISIMVTKADEIAFQKPQKKMQLSNLKFSKIRTTEREKNLKLTRKFHWRDLLYDYESWRGKRNR